MDQGQLHQRLALRAFRSTVLIALAPIGSVVAQDAYVYYDHHPGAASLDGRLSYVRSGRDAGSAQTGRPPLLVVPSGSQLCIQVVNRNEVLYSYTRTAETLPADTIAGLSALFKKVTGALATRDAAVSKYDSYVREVAHLYAMLESMRASQLASDTVVDFTRAAAEIARLSGEAADTNRAATVAYQALGGDTAVQVRLLRAVHAYVWSRIELISTRFRRALDSVNDPICTEVGTNRLRVTLKIARTSVDTNVTPQRPVGDTVLTVDVNPRDDRAFLLQPGTILSAFTQDKSTISLNGGIVAQTPDHGLGVHAGVFAMARAGSIRWLWVTLGVATSDQGVSDVFVGMTFRGGASFIGGRINAGVGLALTRVPVGVSQGSVGSALPADVQNVDDVIQRDFRPGLGVTFAVQIP
jgi:hypothetical protein